MNRKNLMLGLLLAVSVLIVAGCSQSQSPSISPSNVTFDIELIEIKGATDGISAPDVDPVSLSQGYRYKAPGEYDEGNPDKWQVSTYMFSPGAASVFQNDTVTLRMFGVNGDEHVLVVQAPDGSTVASGTVNRGREVEFTFDADLAGYYTLICANHAPTMQTPIQVVPVS